jgi:hypothetical protein
MTKVKSNNILLYYYVLGRESADLYYTSSVVSTTLARTHFLVLFFASGNDDDINDVACMAGVNLQVRQGAFHLWDRVFRSHYGQNLRGKSRSTLYQKVENFFVVYAFVDHPRFQNFISQEEQSKILATNSEILNLQLRSCKDAFFLNNKVLQKQIEDIGKFTTLY